MAIFVNNLGLPDSFWKEGFWEPFLVSLILLTSLLKRPSLKCRLKIRRMLIRTNWAVLVWDSRISRYFSIAGRRSMTKYSAIKASRSTKTRSSAAIKWTTLLQIIQSICQCMHLFLQRLQICLRLRALARMRGFICLRYCRIKSCQIFVCGR